MKQLTCEMCGSTDLVKQEGFFVCQTCGCKYSVEEAKKMMIEGTVEVTGTVKVDHTDQIEKYLKMAASAFDSENNQEAEAYCNKVLEIDENNVDAWLIKGLAAGWQSTLANLRIDEAIQCFSHALLNCKSEDEYYDKVEKIYSQFYALIVAVNNLHLKHLKNYMSSENAMAYVGYRSTYLQWDLDLLKADIMAQSKLNKGKETDDYVHHDFHEIDKYSKLIRSQAFHAVEEIWKKSYSEYSSNNNGHPSDYAMEDMMKTAIRIIAILEGLIPSDLSKTTPKECDEIEEYCNAIISHKQSYASLQSYKANYSGGVKSYVTSKKLTETAKQEVYNEINEYKKIINMLKQKRKEAVIEECKNMSIDIILQTAESYLKSGNIIMADCYYDAAIKNDETCSVAYLGKAVAIGDSGGSESDIVKNIILSSKYENKHCDQECLSYLVKYKCGQDKITLLTYAAANINYEASEYMVRLGSDINARCKRNATPLFYLSFEALKPENAESGRRIAKLLIDKGAIFNVTAENGIALFNANTDPEIARMIQEKDPSLQKGSAKASGGCYVATCVYGSYDCPQVWTLRRFRDDTLGATWYGRAFIHTYYAISPTLVKWFGKTTWFKKMWHGTLNRMVAKLNSQGVQDTPYQDKDW